MTDKDTHVKHIEVLGPGCKKCRKLAETVQQAAEELGLSFELEKVSDINRILSYGVMLTPALVVDGQVKVSGRVPDLAEVKAMLA